MTCLSALFAARPAHQRRLRRAALIALFITIAMMAMPFALLVAAQ